MKVFFSRNLFLASIVCVVCGLFVGTSMVMASSSPVLAGVYCTNKELDVFAQACAGQTLKHLQVVKGQEKPKSELLLAVDKVIGGSQNMAAVFDLGEAKGSFEGTNLQLILPIDYVYMEQAFEGALHITALTGQTNTLKLNCLKTRHF